MSGLVTKKINPLLNNGSKKIELIVAICEILFGVRQLRALSDWFMPEKPLIFRGFILAKICFSVRLESIVFSAFWSVFVGPAVCFRGLLGQLMLYFGAGNA